VVKVVVAGCVGGADAFSPACALVVGGTGAGTAGVSLNGSVGDGTSLGMLGAVSAASVAEGGAGVGASVAVASGAGAG
jgi:hypothetical protein